MADPQKDEHIEELLSKLQGIFGKLSHSDDEDPKPKESAPAPAAPAPVPEPLPAAPQVPIDIPQAAPIVTPPPPAAVVPASETTPTPQPDPAPEVPTINVQAPEPLTLSTSSIYVTTVPTEDPEKMIVSSAVCYVPGREAEAKIVAQKLETMAPKFTKVAFRLRVGVCMPYDPRGEWKDAIVAKAAETTFQTVFVIMDRPIDDMKRKNTAAELESRGIYFQEVLIASIEKKAFYTDVLLGLVFFFDSRKPSAAPE